MTHTGARTLAATLAATAALALTVTGIVTAATPAPAAAASFDLSHEDTSDYVTDADGCVHPRGTACANDTHDSRYVMANGQPGGYWLDANGVTLDCDDTDCVFVKPVDPHGAMTVAYAPEQV